MAYELSAQTLAIAGALVVVVLIVVAVLSYFVNKDSTENAYLKGQLEASGKKENMENAFDVITPVKSNDVESREQLLAKQQAQPVPARGKVVIPIDTRLIANTSALAHAIEDEASQPALRNAASNFYNSMCDSCGSNSADVPTCDNALYTFDGDVKILYKQY